MSFIVSFLLSWVLAAIVLLIVDRLNIGLKVGGLGKALVAAFVIAALDLILGNILRLVASPVVCLTGGCLYPLINWLIVALVLYLSAKMVKGFEIVNYVAALVAALVIALINWGVDWLVTDLLNLG